MNFEPEDEEALNLLIPKYITSLIYGGMIEAVASETGPGCRPWIRLPAMRRK